jgi:hypothetical protein
MLDGPLTPRGWNALSRPRRLHADRLLRRLRRAAVQVLMTASWKYVQASLPYDPDWMTPPQRSDRYNWIPVAHGPPHPAAAATPSRAFAAARERTHDGSVRCRG